MTDEPRPILEHLAEVRRRLLWIIGAWAITSLAASFWPKELFEILMAPAIDAVRASGHTLIAVAPSELFMTYLKTILLTGFVLAMPVTLWQLWAFVAPGITRASGGSRFRSCSRPARSSRSAARSATSSHFRSSSSTSSRSKPTTCTRAGRPKPCSARSRACISRSGRRV